METIVERPAALDVHKEQVTACVRTPEYECLLVNARHVKQVPGARPTSRTRPGCASCSRRGCLCSTRRLPAPPIRPCSPTSPGASCAGSCRHSGRRSRVASMSSTPRSISRRADRPALGGDRGADRTSPGADVVDTRPHEDVRRSGAGFQVGRERRREVRARLGAVGDRGPERAHRHDEVGAVASAGHPAHRALLLPARNDVLDARRADDTERAVAGLPELPVVPAREIGQHRAFRLLDTIDPHLRSDGDVLDRADGPVVRPS